MTTPKNLSMPEEMAVHAAKELLNNMDALYMAARLEVFRTLLPVADDNTTLEEFINVANIYTDWIINGTLPSNAPTDIVK